MSRTTFQRVNCPLSFIFYFLLKKHFLRLFLYLFFSTLASVSPLFQLRGEAFATAVAARRAGAFCALALGYELFSPAWLWIFFLLVDITAHGEVAWRGVAARRLFRKVPARPGAGGGGSWGWGRKQQASGRKKQSLATAHCENRKCENARQSVSSGFSH